MNTKKRLNCYLFSNLIISFLTLNMFTNNSITTLVKRSSDNELNKIYDKEIETISVKDTIISNEELTNVISISNKVLESSNKVLENKSTSYVKPSYNSLTGQNLVNYAKNFIGLRYVSAGRSLSTGTDCSGFTSLIYKEFGITLGRTVSSQIYSGTYVSKSDLQPGDLVFYSYGSVASHVAIYIGNGLIIHESNPRDGVKISSVNIMNYITARRLITSNVVSNTAKVAEEIIVENTKQEVVENTKTEELKEEKPILETEVNSSSTETDEVTESVKAQEEVVNNIEVVNGQTTPLNTEVTEEVKEQVKEETKEENLDNSK